MKSYKIQITDKALSDMEEIYNYIAEQLQVPEAAMGQYNRIAAAIETLDTFPERVKLTSSVIRLRKEKSCAPICPWHTAFFLAAVNQAAEEGNQAPEAAYKDIGACHVLRRHHRRRVDGFPVQAHQKIPRG
jgi:plasmid stabilization system protein ParE